MSNWLELYIGQPEDSYQDHLYVDLVVEGKSVTLYEENIDDCDGQGFIRALNHALETALFFSESLEIPIRPDSDMLDTINEFEEEDRKLIKKTIKELLP